MLGLISAMVLLNVAAFALLGTLAQQALDQSNRNAHRIAVESWQTCHDFNKGFVRQNSVIDSAIEAERRRDRPDAQRINDLVRFKLPVRDCGRRP